MMAPTLARIRHVMPASVVRNMNFSHKSRLMVADNAESNLACAITAANATQRAERSPVNSPKASLWI